MKRVKRVLALLAAFALVLAMAVPAFAASITITGGENGSEYAAYKLLDVTISTSGEGESAKTNYAYTVNSKYTSILKSVTGKTTDKDIIAYVAELTNEGTRQFADAVYAQIKKGKITADTTTSNNKFDNVDKGYYLIAETKVGTADGSYSLIMLSTLDGENINVATKEDVPTVEKKVKDTNDSTGETSEWQDSADADIGDELEYKLTGTVSAKIANYKQYYYEFVDTMTNLIYVENSVNVKVDGVDVTSQFTTAWDATKKVLTVKIADLKKLTGVTTNADTEVVVTYKATLDKNANIGSAGNPNTVKLKYSNNPYQDGNGTPTTSETPEDKNIVFTYEVVANKVDQNKKPLADAKFELFKKIKGTEVTWKSLGEVAAASADGKYTAAWKGIDDGEYKLVETHAPDGYNKMEDQYFTVIATHETESSNPTLTAVTGTAAGDSTIQLTGAVGNGSLTTEIVNQSGTVLPSTGGMGTTVFYVVGGGLMAVAVVLLVTKKRMENKR